MDEVVELNDGTTMMVPGRLLIAKSGLPDEDTSELLKGGGVARLLTITSTIFGAASLTKVAAFSRMEVELTAWGTTVEFPT
jgi:hypothetical protein